MEKKCRPSEMNNMNQLKMLGIGLAKISGINTNGKYEILYSKGIGNSLIQDIFELYKNEILNKERGNSIIPLDEFTLYINYFQHKEDILVLIYMDEKNQTINYPQLYMFTKKVSNHFRLNRSLHEIVEIFENDVKIPQTEGIDAVLILSSSGCLYYSKINEKNSTIANSELHISGFISALYSFSREIINQDSGGNLKEINFGNQLFYIITQDNIIFVYLVKKLDPLIQRYMYVLADEFINEYQAYLMNFNGDVTPFNEFEKIINKYLKI
ncbi:MAG: hypothetical protein EU539_03705 [Promethearchaeota archaeon]|nr:MAG: hypothetical protein EU539_03705 [Candidatus Lokiarchaeota archaeon]